MSAISLASVASSLIRASQRTDDYELAKALIGGERKEATTNVSTVKTVGQDGYLPSLIVAKAWAAVRENAPEHALELLEEAEKQVRGNTGHIWQARQVALLVAAFARTATPDHGTALIARIGLSSLTAWRTWSWRSAVLSQVDQWCGTAFDGVCFLATTARGVALAGDHDLAARTLRQAEDLLVARTHSSGLSTTWGHADSWIPALTALGAAAGEIGGRKRTSELINHCTHILLSDSLSHTQRIRALSAVARLAVALGHDDKMISVPDRAERVTPRTRSVSRPEAGHSTDPADDKPAGLPAPVDEMLRSESWRWAVPAVVEAVPEAFEMLVAELATAARMPHLHSLPKRAESRSRSSPASPARRARGCRPE